jgi:peptidoglycan/LPS O-acetylase OafA/YrhL
LLAFIGIEFFRGIAAMMVLLAHYAQFITSGRTLLNFFFTGVDLFFVISGFVFGKAIFSGNIFIKSYLIRRFFRIYPLYLVALLIYYMLCSGIGPKNYYFVRHFFFLHTTSSVEEAFFFNPAFWSLPVEIEFYLFLPCMVYIQRLKYGLSALFIFSFVLKIFIALDVYIGLQIPKILAVHLTGILPEFFIGIYMYRILILKKHPVSRLVNLSSFLSGMLMIAVLSGYFVIYGNAGLENNPALGGMFGFLSALGYALMMVPFISRNIRNDQSTFIKTAIFLGSISYSVYLIHNAVPHILGRMGMASKGGIFFLASLLLSIAVSIFLNKCIEEPFRMYGRRLSLALVNKTKPVLVSPK